MKYKAIFSDFDLTIFSENFTISPKDVTAIKKYQDKGGNFMISTGRLYKSIAPYLPELGLTKGKIVVSQGAEIYDIETGERLYQELVPLDLVKKIIDYVESYFDKTPNVTMFTYINDEIYFIDRWHEAIKGFCDVVNVEPNIIQGSIWDFIKAAPNLPSKILAMIEEPMVQEFMESGKKATGEEASFFASRHFLVEMMSKDVNKGTGVKRVADMLGIDLDDVICIGDSDNDVPMIDVAGLGIAPANSFDRVKAHAKYIAPSCNDSPIADIIEKFCND